ncbi:hypothetical protein PHLGIDRAFT_447046 [Phlebiopsis gigantea 11061_1 CR5-6]|uniref:BTB domain-containing protein n=1 Tax=Phlebiopsis gigantea (strain 11061_1 CR5-6) TaxID=745531 RepID=A0A0C3RXQ6_PHLG1|nr:hypothetical protein PHLGIDRAFT_447046 [Phlebiopsis gigantea 11061_1 CR5-6]
MPTAIKMTRSKENINVPTSATEPFDEGDVMRRTADDVDFRVLWAALPLASPFFKGLFSLRQPDTSRSTSIPVPEDSATLACLLRCCHLIRNPFLDDLELLARVLEAAIKSDMDEGVARAAFRSYRRCAPPYIHQQLYVALRGLGCNCYQNLEGYPGSLRRRCGCLFGDRLWTHLHSREVSTGCFCRQLNFLRGEPVESFCAPSAANSRSNDGRSHVAA